MGKNLAYENCLFHLSGKRCTHKDVIDKYKRKGPVIRISSEICSTCEFREEYKPLERR